MIEGRHHHSPRSGATDWDQYYRRPFAAASVTRGVTRRKLIRLFSNVGIRNSPTILELGGANSAFADAIASAMHPKRYAVADTNACGLTLFRERFPDTELFPSFEVDAVDLPAGLAGYDVVFSVGLIEHFSPYRTARCIASHFKACRPGGIVLITFPTPTLLYRMIRSAAEKTGHWIFHDERPLQFAEVHAACRAYGDLVHESITWQIGLTQGCAVYRRR